MTLKDRGTVPEFMFTATTTDHIHLYTRHLPLSFPLIPAVGISTQPSQDVRITPQTDGTQLFMLPIPHLSLLGCKQAYDRYIGAMQDPNPTAFTPA